MSYRFEIDEHAGHAARRVAAEQATRGLAELGNTAEPIQWRIHQLRKRCKKIRAVARLIRKDLPGYGKHNRQARDIARAVSDERDARVLFELYRELLAGRDDEDDADPDADPLLRWYRLHCDLAEELAAPVLPMLEQELARVREAIEQWDVSAVDDSSLLAGVGKSLKRAHKQRRKARRTRSSAVFHEWRKRCKYHWYHLRLLESRLPRELAERVEIFDELGEQLGDAHDRTVLLEDLERLPGFMRSHATAKFIAAEAIGERRKLRLAALDTSEPVFEQPAAEFTDRLAAHW